MSFVKQTVRAVKSAVYTSQVRNMAHNPKKMRDAVIAKAHLEDVRERLLSGTFVKKLNGAAKRKSKLYASPSIGFPVTKTESHYEKPTVQSWIFNLDKERVGLVNLDKNVFQANIDRTDLVHRTVVWQLAKRRSGTHQSLNRSTISGTGKKPHPQKKSGRARASTLRSPLHYHGARAFPRRNRDYGYHLPTNIRKLALKIAISAKRHDGRLIILDAAKTETHKTSALKDKFEKFGNNKVVVITGDYEQDPNFTLASRNIHDSVSVLPARGANVYDIVRAKTLFMTLQGMNDVVKRVSRSKRGITFPGQKYVLKPVAEVETAEM